MFKVKGNYPYPILLEEPNDYKTSYISVRYLYQALKDAHKIKIECQINNNKILDLIENKKVSYAIQIECPNAMYRKMFEFYDKDEMIITIPNDEVIDFIDIGLALLVKEEIENFENEDFIDAYKGIKMNINKNEILGVCQNVRQMIISNNEIFKDVHSIFKIKKEKDAEHITYDPHHNRILIRIPEKIGFYYLSCKEFKQRIDVLNAIIIMPVLTNIITDMKEDESELSGYKWFKTLTKKINEIMKEQKLTKEEMFNNQVLTAQLIMKNISVKSIEEFKEIIEE